VLTPKKVTMPGKVVDIAANSPHRCALLADDSVWCWGSGTMLELGDGKEEARDKPVRVVFPK
jgi:alpha-tubulin suppressor-like RCC1 family protein